MKLKSLRVVAAALLSVFAIGAAFALQVDQTRIMSKRFYNTDQPVYYRLTINYNDANISTAQMFGALGQSAFIKAIDCNVTAAFNAGTSNFVTFGTSTTATEIANTTGGATGSITAGSTGNQHLTTAVGLGLNATSAADTTLYAKYAQTGTAATAGSVTCVIEFVPNNDM